MHIHRPTLAVARAAAPLAGLLPGSVYAQKKMVPGFSQAGVESTKGAFAAKMACKLKVSVECSPLLGPHLMSAVKDLKAGKTLQKRIVTEEGIFSMEVAAKEFPKRKY